MIIVQVVNDSKIKENDWISFSYVWIHLSYNQWFEGQLTTNLELTFCSICFSLRAICSPFRFLIRFFSSFLQAYILPVALTWQAHTSPKPPLPNTLYMRNVFFVTGALENKMKSWNVHRNAHE